MKILVTAYLMRYLDKNIRTSNWRTHLCIVFIFCSLGMLDVTVCNAQDDSQAAAMQILQRTAATYQKLNSYAFDVTVHLSRGSAVAEQCSTMTGERTTKYRIDDHDSKSKLRIADGKVEWVLSRSSNTYTKTSLTPTAWTPISDFENIDQHVVGAEIMREEQYVADGKNVQVYVVGVTRNPWPPGTLPNTNLMMYRIDETTFAVYEVTAHTPDQIGETETTLYTNLSWNQHVPETTFAFSPPSLSEEAASTPSSAPLTATLIGAEAPDFTLQSIDGRRVSLRDFRGKVVIVDFWASWCPPCRAEMPYLEELQKRFAGKGLVVLGLDSGEDSQTVSQFAKEESYTFTLLLGGQPGAETSYYVGALPTTFIVNRQGKILYQNDGFGPPAELLSAVENALK